MSFSSDSSDIKMLSIVQGELLDHYSKKSSSPIIREILTARNPDGTKNLRDSQCFCEACKVTFFYVSKFIHRRTDMHKRMIRVLLDNKIIEEPEPEVRMERPTKRRYRGKSRKTLEKEGLPPPPPRKRFYERKTITYTDFNKLTDEEIKPKLRSRKRSVSGELTPVAPPNSEVSASDDLMIVDY